MRLIPLSDTLTRTLSIRAALMAWYPLTLAINNVRPVTCRWTTFTSMTTCSVWDIARLWISILVITCACITTQVRQCTTAFQPLSRRFLQVNYLTQKILKQVKTLPIPNHSRMRIAISKYAAITSRQVCTDCIRLTVQEALKPAVMLVNGGCAVIKCGWITSFMRRAVCNATLDITTTSLRTINSLSPCPMDSSTA